MSKFSLFLSIFLAGSLLVHAQSDNGVLRMDEFRSSKKRDNIIIPDVGGYHTLKCDFHMHTMFSDGLVWPTVRVQEAWQEGLDVMAITDHIEYQPHSKDVIVNHNRPWELAKDMAAENNIIFIKGTEITRATPPGHFNALFIGDASGYVEEREDNSKDKEAISKAVEQDAFIFWNHPGWKVSQIEGSYEWVDFVDELYKERSVHGIEVFNGFGFHKKALDWCVDHNLTVMGTTDVHNVIGYDYNLGEIVHRTMTLVFAKERTEESVREALEAGRTVAWASKYIAGKEEHVENLFNACVEVSPAFHSKNDRRYFEVTNNSDLYFEMNLKEGDGTAGIVLFPRSKQVITAGADQQNLTYEVGNAFIRSDKNLIVDIPLK
ncbi:MAG: histidinol-phosphatase [Bacteroidales bacterium]|jgi:predicted metal-dependent phosphoesterase TrpH|nr:histidinol-phosphatase [Bacteroidales bacterium]